MYAHTHTHTHTHTLSHTHIYTHTIAQGVEALPSLPQSGRLLHIAAADWNRRSWLLTPPSRLPRCCSVLGCVAVCCSALKCCVVLQCLRRVAVCCGVLQCVAVCCSVLQCVVVCCGDVSHRCIDAADWKSAAAMRTIPVGDAARKASWKKAGV